MPRLLRLPVFTFIAGFSIGMFFAHQLISVRNQFVDHYQQLYANQSQNVENQMLQDSAYNYHRDSVKAAEDLVKKIRVLCWVMTHPGNYESRALVIQELWGRKCDQLLFVSEKNEHANSSEPKKNTLNTTMPMFHVDQKLKGREHLTAKTMQAFQHIYEHHFNEAEWFLKTDDVRVRGIESISDYAITFHYVSPEDMYNMEFLLYHLRPYGIISGLQDLNIHQLVDYF